MERKFILVKTVQSHHIIPVDEIIRVSTFINDNEIRGKNNSEIILKSSEFRLYSIQTPEEIYKLIIATH